MSQIKNLKDIQIFQRETIDFDKYPIDKKEALKIFRAYPTVHTVKIFLSRDSLGDSVPSPGVAFYVSFPAGKQGKGSNTLVSDEDIRAADQHYATIFSIKNNLLSGNLDRLEINTPQDFTLVDQLGDGFIHLLVNEASNSPNDLMKSLRFLLDKGVNIDQRNYLGETPIYLAAAADNLNLTRFLAEQGADLEISDRQGFKPLCIAAINGYRDILMTLLDHGATPKIQWGAAKTATQSMLDIINSYRERKKLGTVILSPGEGDEDPSLTL